MQPVLLDTGVIAAWLNRRDEHHARCSAFMAELHRPLVTCEAVVDECSFLLQAIPRAIEDVLANVASGNFLVPFHLAQSAGKVRDLMHKYSDTPADFADACLIQMADELNTGDILTVDSDFRHYRWRRNRRFNLLLSSD